MAKIKIEVYYSRNIYPKGWLFLLLIGFYSNVYGQAPTISYTPPNYTFTINVPITPIAPILQASQPVLILISYCRQV